MLLDAVLENRRRRRHRQHGGTGQSGNEEDVKAKRTRHEGGGEEDGLSLWEGGSGGRDSWDVSADDDGTRRLSGEGERQDDGELLLGDGSAVRIPTFAEVVDTLKNRPWKAPMAFRPLVGLCGHQHSPFDSVIPFERLQVGGCTRPRWVEFPAVVSLLSFFWSWKTARDDPSSRGRSCFSPLPKAGGVR